MKICKKILSLLLSALMILSVFSGISITSFASETVLPGDADGDGYTTSADARIILNNATGWDPTPEYKTIHDLNNDGKITTDDAKLCLSYSAYADSPETEIAPVRTSLNLDRSSYAKLNVISQPFFPGQEFTVSISVSNITYLDNANLFFTYDSSALEFISLVSIVKDSDNGIIDYAIYDTGKISLAFACNPVTALSSPNGNIDITQITFRALSKDVAPFECHIGTIGSNTDVPEDIVKSLIKLENITEGETKTVTINDNRVFEFTPETTGTYIFSSETYYETDYGPIGILNPAGKIYDNDGNLIAEGNNSEECKNFFDFHITSDLEAEKTYYLIPYIVSREDHFAPSVFNITIKKFENITENITEGETKTVTINDNRVFEFTPETTGTYIFSSETYYETDYGPIGILNPAGKIYDNDGNLIAEGNNSEECKNFFDFHITSDLEAGKTYYLIPYIVSREDHFAPSVFNITIKKEFSLEECTFGDWNVTTPATCTQEGAKVRKCTLCGKEESEVITKKDHNLEHVTIDSTCIVAGMEYDICTECDETFNSKTLSLADHTIVTIPGKAATCTKTGLSDGAKCSVCNAVITAQTEIAAKGHNFGEWKTTKEATYINEGERARTCSCGEKQTEKIAKLVAEKESVDKSSNVSVKFTNDTYNGEMKVTATEQFDGSSYQILNNEKGKFKNTLFDIITTVDGNKVQPDGMVLVGIPLPEGYNANETIVYYVASDGSGLKKMNSFYKDGMIWFETDHFSAYALVDESSKKTTSYTMGDINGDNKITAADARLVLRVSAKLEKLSAEAMSVADVTKDNKITAADARLILRVSAKLDKFN